MSNAKTTPPPARADDFEASLHNIMERLRRQAEEIAQLRRDLDKVRTGTSIATPGGGVPLPSGERAKNEDESDS